MAEQVTPGDERELIENMTAIERLEQLAHRKIAAGGKWNREYADDLLEVTGLARRVSPVTREALIELLESSQHAPMNTHDPRSGECVQCPWPLHELGSAEIADAILAEFPLSVSPPAEVEWEHGVEITYDWAESTPSIQWVENLASADRLMKDTPLWVHAPERIISKRRMRRVKAGPWVPVTPGEGKGQ